MGIVIFGVFVLNAIGITATFLKERMTKQDEFEPGKDLFI